MALSILDGNQSATTLSTILSSGQHITAHTVVSLGTQAITDITSAVSGTSVCVGSISISGTVTANNTNLNRLVQNGEFTDTFGVPIIYARVAGGALDYWQEVSQISGLPVKNQLTTGGDIVPFSVSGSVTASISGTVPVSISSVTVGNSVTIGSLPTLAPQLPRVTFIDGSGSVTTANSAITVFATSTTRSYLLVQVTTGSAFVNVGATATTVNGINLTAGQGYAWETTIPQGLVSLISTTTSSRWVAKEA
jgi:hypothetical protein